MAGGRGILGRERAPGRVPTRLLHGCPGDGGKGGTKLLDGGLVSQTEGRARPDEAHDLRGGGAPRQRSDRARRASWITPAMSRIQAPFMAVSLCPSEKNLACLVSGLAARGVHPGLRRGSWGPTIVCRVGSRGGLCTGREAITCLARGRLWHNICQSLDHRCAPRTPDALPAHHPYLFHAFEVSHFSGRVRAGHRRPPHRALRRRVRDDPCDARPVGKLVGRGNDPRPSPARAGNPSSPASRGIA
jgi:hypothetical protein